MRQFLERQSIPRGPLGVRGAPILLTPFVLLLLSGCYEIGLCPKFEPPLIWETRLYVAAMRDDRAAVEEIFQKYERSGDPDILRIVAEGYSLGYGEFENDAARDSKIVEYKKKAALCGNWKAVNGLAYLYEAGKYGLEPFPEMARCLRRMAKANKSAAECGVTLDDSQMPEPSEVPFPRGEAYGDIRCASSPDGWISELRECSSP